MEEFSAKPQRDSFATIAAGIMAINAKLHQTVFGNVHENKRNLFQWPVLHVEQSNVWASKSVFGHGLP